jgi:hypothetical protein
VADFTGIGILALLVERVAEIGCNEPWTNVRRKLQELQISQFISSEYSFFRRNGILANSCKVLKYINFSIQKMVLGLKKTILRGVGTPRFLANHEEARLSTHCADILTY